MNKSSEILNEVKKAVIGKDNVLAKAYLAILAGGHILLEDIPGVGKTTMALAFSKALELDYSRMQFTPDVLPSDIVGFSIYNKDTREMEYRRGAVLCNLFLADELNRATSRTQSALLEAMEENQVTVDGVSHPLPNPFIVIATQNPAGAAGTQLLPESQLDRFMVKLTLGYPDEKSEVEILNSRKNGAPLDSVKRIVTTYELENMKKEAASVFISEPVYSYIVRLVAATRNDEFILRGASPRASLSLMSIAKARAYALGRDYVVPDDVRAFFSDCVSHRIILTPDGEDRGRGEGFVLDRILKSVVPPAIK